MSNDQLRCCKALEMPMYLAVEMLAQQFKFLEPIIGVFETLTDSFSVGSETAR